jgi:hypothetical protein
MITLKMPARDYFLSCSSGRTLKLVVPDADTVLPEVTRADEVHVLVSPPRLLMIVCDDENPDALASSEEQMEALRSLESKNLIPESWADALRCAIEHGLDFAVVRDDLDLGF